MRKKKRKIKTYESPFMAFEMTSQKEN